MVKPLSLALFWQVKLNNPQMGTETLRGTLLNP